MTTPSSSAKLTPIVPQRVSIQRSKRIRKAAPKGAKTGQKGAVAIISRNGKILMQRRREHIADPGTWVLPGGECRRIEKPRETLIRVCAEELGITVRPSKEIGKLDLPDSICPAWHVIWKGREVKLSGEDIVGIGWFTPEELMELTPVRHENELRKFLMENEEVVEVVNTSEVSKKRPEPASPDEQKILALISEAKQGDHESFGKLYDLYVTPIHRYVAFRLPQALVEDIVADVFVKAWEKLDSYKGRKGTPFSSWLFRIAKHVVIDTYRTQKEIVELDEVHVDEDRWNDPVLGITQEMQAKLLRQAMNKLPKRYREVLLLSFMSNLGHGEIARAMKMREGGVRILKHRALKKLGELLPVSMREELP